MVINHNLNNRQGLAQGTEAEAKNSPFVVESIVRSKASGPFALQAERIKANEANKGWCDSAC